MRARCLLRAQGHHPLADEHYTPQLALFAAAWMRRYVGAAPSVPPTSQVGAADARPGRAAAYSLNFSRLFVEPGGGGDASVCAAGGLGPTTDCRVRVAG